MNKQGIIHTIKTEKPYLQSEFGVKEIALFGSYARGLEQQGSDVDILVDLEKPSYSALMGVYIYLEKKLNAKVDIIRKGTHLSDKFLNQISKDLIYV